MSTLNTIALFILSFTFSGNLISQTSLNQSNQKNDSLECLKSISVYKEFQKLNLKDETISGWHTAYKTCKGFKKIIYQDGVKFLRQTIENEKNAKTYDMLVDSLAKLYDERMHYFGEEAYVLGLQGLDLLKYGKDKYLEKANACLKKSFELRQLETEPAVMVALMNSTQMLFQKGKVGTDEVLTVYSSILDVLNQQGVQETNTSNLKAIENAKEAVYSIFGKSKAADCKSIDDLLSKRLSPDEKNPDELLRIQKLLKLIKCFDSELLQKVSVQLFKLKPESVNACFLAGLALKKEKPDESVAYLKNAIELESNDSIKASIYYDLGMILCHRQKLFAQAREYALESLKRRPEFGNAYILIGDCYALSAKPESTDIEKSSIYWAACDKYLKAKQIDASCEQTANQKLNYYSQLFPSKEDLFFHNLSEGKSYKITGWINETTLVRARK